MIPSELKRTDDWRPQLSGRSPADSVQKTKFKIQTPSLTSEFASQHKYFHHSVKLQSSMKNGILKNDEVTLRELVKKCFPKNGHILDDLISAKSEVLENAKSFWSLIAKVTLEWREDSKVENLPKTLIIKFPVLTDNVLAAGIPLGIDHLKKELHELTEREVTFYEKLGNDEIPHFPLPHFYYGEILDEEDEENEKGILVLEDVGTSTHAAHHIPGLSVQQVELLVDALAGLHHYTITSPKNWANHSKFQEGIVEENFQQEQVWLNLTPKRLLLYFETTIRLEEICPERFKGKIDQIKLHFDYKKGVRAEQSFKELEMAPVLCHADLNVTNILWDSNASAEHPKLHSIIDFQRFHLAKERKDNTQRLLYRYFETLTDLFDGHPPYPVEKVEEALITIFPYAANFVLFAIVVYYDMYETLEKDEQKRKEIREELLARAEGIVDDLIDMVDPDKILRRRE
ncbi:unnamed protein product, partial [Mesorhabditis belari]|uniref:CHK kinase-like domain-containing protein n=1 Tax=Mesorhabditis belari TaxID=2138241 RepID=A0AAF3FM20_9BILA